MIQRNFILVGNIIYWLCTFSPNTVELTTMRIEMEADLEFTAMLMVFVLCASCIYLWVAHSRRNGTLGKYNRAIACNVKTPSFQLREQYIVAMCV